MLGCCLKEKEPQGRDPLRLKHGRVVAGHAGLTGPYPTTTWRSHQRGTTLYRDSRHAHEGLEASQPTCESSAVDLGPVRATDGQAGNVLPPDTRRPRPRKMQRRLVTRVRQLKCGEKTDWVRVREHLEGRHHSAHVSRPEMQADRPILWNGKGRQGSVHG